MIRVILIGIGSGMAGSLMVFAVRWWSARHARHDTPIYIWPIPGQTWQAQEGECAHLAIYAAQIKQESTRRFAAAWDSGLGKEFPPLGKN